MNANLVPISTLFIGLNGLIAFVLSYIAASERVKARVWHGESKADVGMQPDPLGNPSSWVLTIERLTQRQLQKGEVDAGALQRKVLSRYALAKFPGNCLSQRPTVSHFHPRCRWRGFDHSDSRRQTAPNWYIP